MPISRKDFESGMTPKAKKVVDFLESRPDEAFTHKEIAENTSIDVGEVVDLLNYLYIDADAIDRIKVGRGSTRKFYYASLKKE